MTDTTTKPGAYKKRPMNNRRCVRVEAPFDVVYASEHPPVTTVLELARADAYAVGSYEWGEKLAQARATVERLAEAAAEVRAAHRDLPSADHGAEVRQAGEARIGRAHYELDAALAVFRGDA